MRCLGRARGGGGATEICTGVRLGAGAGGVQGPGGGNAAHGDNGGGNWRGTLSFKSGFVETRVIEMGGTAGKSSW